MPEDEKVGNAGVGFADGNYMPVSELRVPVSDLGFMLSDLCYDAIHVHKGNFFRLKDHLDRWERSIAARRYTTLGYDRDRVTEIMNECVVRANLQDAMVTIVATRGKPLTAEKDLRTCQNRLIAWARPYYTMVSEEEHKTGCDIVIAKTIRIPPQAVDPKVKNYSRLDFVNAKFEAYEANSKYALLLDGDGYVTEGQGWNIFAARNGVLLTPDDGVLEGITRQTVLELAAKSNVEAKLARITVDELCNGDEVFMTSTAGGIMPIRSINSRPVGDGTPGPLTMHFSKMYWDMHEDSEWTTPVRYSAD